jgi:type II secretory pathway pseudopilin PulG
MGMLTTLIVTICSLLNIDFSAINLNFPDRLDQYGNYYYSYKSTLDAMRLAISVLVFSLPLYLVLAWLGFRETRSVTPVTEPVNRYPVLGISRWIVYLTVSITVAFALGTLSTLVYKFLGGEISTRFVLKCFVLLVVIAVSSIYYFESLRVGQSKLALKIHGTVIALLVIVSIVIGFVYIGSPMDQRALELDEQRSSALSQVDQAVQMHADSQQRLPATIDEASIVYYGGKSSFVDPVTGKAIEYKVVSDTQYQVCATFETDTTKFEDMSNSMVRGAYESFMSHPAGRHCFDRSVVFPQRNNGVVQPIMPAPYEVRP